MLHGLCGFFNGEHLEHMPHILPFLHPAHHAGGGHPLAEHGGIRIEDLVGANLDQRGREAGEIPKEWGQLGILHIRISGVGAADGVNIILGNRGIQFLSLLIGGAGSGHIRPRGHQDQPPGQHASGSL